MSKKDPPAEVTDIRNEIRAFFQQDAGRGRTLGSAKCGVYAFFDYDGEPIYVGQTIESLSGRVGRHLTGRRSDAVAKFVLDPFEVLDIEVWPLFPAEVLPRVEKKRLVDTVEYNVYVKALDESRFRAVLNEGVIRPTDPVELPRSYRGRIIPDRLYQDRRHPDVRIARRAATISNLAKLISERKVEKGLRQVLWVQSRRLEALSLKRLHDFADEPLEVDQGEE